MNEPLETIMEVREDFMVSPAGDIESTLRTAHFLKPTSNSIDEPVSEVLSSSVSSVPPIFEPNVWPLATHFNGWRRPTEKWIGWVDSLHPKYESVWKKVGIFEAIMSTECCILKNEDLTFGVAEKWCSRTNTFVFACGEATITLEDVMVLGGYPVLGGPVFTPLENQEMKEIEEKLVLKRKEARKSKQNKASTSAWMGVFINSGSEIDHEAFLAAWLSIFVFTHHNRLVRKSVLPIAVHLARGNPIALAPAVLASIYKDLGLLKKTIVGVTKIPIFDDEVQLEVTLRSPFYLVQIWVWERLKNLQPQPKLINSGDPILARWDEEDFLWRPYVRYAGKCRVFYPENEMWVPFDTDLDKELLVSFVTCLRVSELVGFGSVSCTKKYLPHRVAMQFGMDQDVPGCVPRFNETQAIAWENYCRPISDRNLYFPSRLCQADVTTRYSCWWKQLVLGHRDPIENIVNRKRSARSTNHRPQASKANRSGNDADVPPGFPPKHLKICTFGKSVQHGSEDDEKRNAHIPIGCPPKHNSLNPGNSFEDCMPIVLAKIKCGGMTLSHEDKHLSNQSHNSSASTADFGAVRKILSQTKPVAKDKTEPSMGALEEDFEDANGSK